MPSLFSLPIVVAVPILVAWIMYPVFTTFPPPYSHYTPTPISSTSIQRFPPFPPNFEGVYELNEKLAEHAIRLFEGGVDGTESVAVSPDGTLIMLDKYGKIQRAKKTDKGFTLLDELPMYIGPGRPLGFHVVNNGKALLVCDSLKGLIKVNLLSGEITILANHISGLDSPIQYCNDLDVAKDGTVYFSSSTKNVVIWDDKYSYYDTMRSYLLNMISGDKTGRLLAYDPKTKKTSIILDNIWYANGVTLAHDEESVFVVETTGFRVIQYWLKGPRQGESDTLVDKLPGFPDGITKSSDGNYWLALVSPLSPLLKTLGWRDSLRYAVSHLLVNEDVTKRVVKKWGCVIKISQEGEVLNAYFDPKGKKVSTISAVTEHDGQLFLGNLKSNFVSIVNLEDLGN